MGIGLHYPSRRASQDQELGALTLNGPPTETLGLGREVRFSDKESRIDIVGSDYSRIGCCVDERSTCSVGVPAVLSIILFPESRRRVRSGICTNHIAQQTHPIPDFNMLF